MGWSISFKDEALGDTETKMRDLVFAVAVLPLTAIYNQRSYLGSLTKVLTLLLTEYFIQLSQQYFLYHVIEIWILISLWWGKKANPKGCELRHSLWGKSSPVPEAYLQCGRNNSSQKPETKLVTNFQQQVVCRPPKKGELDSFILKHSP